MKKRKYIRHGMSGHPLYDTWKSMRRRCQDKQHKAYKWYGGIGIKVDEAWEDIHNFVNWASHYNFQNKQLDRVDPTGNYTPSNCRFITPIANKRRQKGHKLNLSIAKEIRKRYCESGISQNKLAALYGVSGPTVHGIIHNRYYQQSA